MRGVPTLRVGESLAVADPPTGRVCVIVPAHNESRVIAGLVRSLRAETHPDMRVVLALDRCTDDTASLARDQIGNDGRSRSSRSTPVRPIGPARSMRSARA
jgi:glycosyltransferase involved in cell wall biosynthesis